VNAYWCDAGIWTVEIDRVEVWPIYAQERLCGVVVAETRGKAKAAFAADYSWEGVEFCHVRTRKLAGDVEGPARSVEDMGDPAYHLWDLTEALA